MARLTPDVVQRIVLHHTATPPSLDWGAAEIDREHRKRGFLSIGYHDVIRRDGLHEKGRPITKPGAHTRGHNKTSVGIVMVGGVDEDLNPEDNFTQAQMDTLRRVVVGRLREFGLTPEDIYGHGEMTNTLCPAFDVEEVRNSIPY